MMRAASNSMLMPTAAPPGPAYWGLTFTAEEAGSTIAMEKVSNNSTPPPAVSLETSTDGETWTPFIIGTTTITLTNVGDRVFFRAGDGGTGGDGVNIKFATSTLRYNKFVMTGTIAASGDISSILDRSGTVLSFAASESLEARSYAFTYLFYGCTSLTAAPELPATTLASSCYRNMFSGCTSLTAAPELPATTLANYCYNNMFNGCASLLTTAPELPATTLADFCYYAMFNGCTSLTTAPELPATTLDSQCYNNMFNGCASLTTAPELPATTLADFCYYAMFKGCTALTTAPELPATTLESRCYYSMFDGCTALTTAPELPATTLANSCYRSMFNGCTSLTTAPELPAGVFAAACCRELFKGCTALADITVAFQSWGSISTAFTNWVSGVAASGTFRCPAALGTDETIERGANRCPEGWTVINI